MDVLRNRGAVCGKELAAELGVSGALVSHHVKILEDSGLVIRRREGQYSRFVINAERMQSLRHCAALAGAPESGDDPGISASAERARLGPAGTPEEGQAGTAASDGPTPRDVLEIGGA